MRTAIDKLGKVAVTVEKDYWSNKKTYDKLTIVEKKGVFGTYISRKAVPAGIDITNREYWIPFSSLKEEIVLKFNELANSVNEKEAEIYNAITSIIAGGVALKQSLGNSEVFGISQKKITEEFSDVRQKAAADDDALQTQITDNDTRIRNIADEEDLTMVSVDEQPAIKLKDKAYEPEKYSGLGRKYLRKNITYDIKIVHFGGFVENVAVQAIGAVITNGNSSNVVYDRIRKSFLYMEKKDLGTPAKYYDVWTSDEVNYDDYYQSSFTTGYTIRTDVVFMLGNVPYRWDDNDKELAVWDEFYEAHSKNILTQEMFNNPNTIYHIQYDYDLNGKSITIPEGCTLEFEGGSLRNGTLAGELKTDTPLDVKSIGCVYNDAAYSEHNVKCLKILEGITNDVHLEINDTLYLGGGNVNIQKSLFIEGNENTIYVHNFNGFTVAEDFTACNIKVIAYEIPSSQNSIFAVFRDVNCVSNCTISSCHFNGKIRVVNNLKLTNEELSKFFKEILIENCTFENVVYTNGGTLVINFSDTNFVNFTLQNNSVHNFYSQFLSAGITNNSSHVSNISNFCALHGRNLIVRGNHVDCDLDWKPWEKGYVDSAYFCFVLAEQGYCLYEGNNISNIIGYTSSNAVYDSYLSVNDLIYQNNKIENCLNIHPSQAYNQVMKSKECYGVRVYTGNIFTTTNLSDFFTEIEDSPRVILFHLNSDVQKIDISNNIFNIYKLYQSFSHLWKSKNISFENNQINVEKFKLDDNACVVSAVSGSNVLIKGNVIIVNEYLLSSTESDNKSYPTLFGVNSSTNNVNITIKDNRMTNMILLNNVGGCSGVISDNTCKTNVYIDDYKYCLVRRLSQGLTLRNNMIETKFIQAKYFCLYTYAKSYSVHLKASMDSADGLLAYIFEGNRSNEINTTIYNVIITVSGKNIPNTKSDIQSISVDAVFEFNLKMEYDEGEGAWLYSYFGYKDSGKAETIIGSSSVFLHNFAFKTITSSRSRLRRGLRISSTSQTKPSPIALTMYPNDDIFVNVEVNQTNDFYKLHNHLHKGATSVRPTDALTINDSGFQYFDTTLGKPIYLKVIEGVKSWVDATGAEV